MPARRNCLRTHTGRAVSSHIVRDAAGRDRQIVHRDAAVTKTGAPIINNKTGKQLKRCRQHFIGYPDGKKPEHWRELPYNCRN